MIHISILIKILKYCMFINIKIIWTSWKEAGLEQILEVETDESSEGR